MIAFLAAVGRLDGFGLLLGGRDLLPPSEQIFFAPALRAAPSGRLIHIPLRSGDFSEEDGRRLKTRQENEFLPNMREDIFFGSPRRIISVGERYNVRKYIQ